MQKNGGPRMRWVFVTFSGLALAACGSDRTPGAGTSPAADIFQVTSTASVSLCRLEGPSLSKPGVYGTDLGFSFLAPAQGKTAESAILLFGDTWKSSDSVCDYPPRRSDDLQATLPAARPAALGPGTAVSDSARSVCGLIKEPPPDASDPTTPRPIRLFPDSGDRTDDKIIYTDFNRTPVAGFSDETHAFMMFVRNEPERCDTNADCDGSLICTKDPSYTGKPLGECNPPLALSVDPAPAICRIDAGGKGDCGAHRTCVVPDRGVCRAKTPFVSESGASPPWYDHDARDAMAQTLYVASAAWPDRPEDYATGARFVTNKFINPVVRTVKHFDPADPSRNDYRRGAETILMWGRPGFWGRRGFVPLLFFAYEPLDGFIDSSNRIHFAPKYFAGYDAAGKPKWSGDEADAVPVYGADAAIAGDGGAGTEPEFDLVNQMTVSFVEPLNRWVMFYGGDLPTWLLYDPATDTELTPVHAEPVPGAIHMRYASHPWGRSTRTARAEEGWSAPEAVLTRETAAPYLGCEDQAPMLAGCTPDHDPHRPLQLVLTLDDFTSITPSDYPAVTQSCVDGTAQRNATYKLSGDGSGHLYAPNIIESWTEDVSHAVKETASGERAVDLYFNVSTWNPYGVALMKAELVARPIE